MHVGVAGEKAEQRRFEEDDRIQPGLGGVLSFWPRGPFAGEPFAAHFGPDVCLGLAVDTLGNAYVTGGTTSTNLNGRTTTTAFDRTKNGATDAYLVKFDPEGNLGDGFPGTFFTFLGFVQDLVLATPLNDVVKGTVTIQRSGASAMVPHT